MCYFYRQRTHLLLSDPVTIIIIGIIVNIIIIVEHDNVIIRIVTSNDSQLVCCGVTNIITALLPIKLQT